MSLIDFELPFGSHLIRGDSYKKGCEAMVLHGAGGSSRTRFSRMRQYLHEHGISSASFDFVGHGETGGELLGSTLHGRTDQAAAVIRHTCVEPLTLIGASMSGYTAVKLTGLFSVENLILLVPAVYTPKAYDLAFGPELSAAIRTPGSWQSSDAFNIISEFRGSLLVIAAESDDVIPREVIERLYASATKARLRALHVVPGSGHLSLFPTERDFVLAMDRIMDVCLYKLDKVD